MITITCEVNGRAAHLFKAERYERGPAQWVVTNPEELGILFPVFRCNNLNEGLRYDHEEDRRIGHSIARQIGEACKRMGIRIN